MPLTFEDAVARDDTPQTPGNDLRTRAGVIEPSSRTRRPSPSRRPRRRRRASTSPGSTWCFSTRPRTADPRAAADRLTRDGGRRHRLPAVVPWRRQRPAAQPELAAAAAALGQGGGGAQVAPMRYSAMPSSYSCDSFSQRSSWPASVPPRSERSLASRVAPTGSFS